AGPRSVRGLAFVEDGPGRPESHRVREPRSGRDAGKGARLLRRGGAEEVLRPVSGDSGRGPADRLPLLPGRPAGGLVADSWHCPVAERHSLQLQRVVRPQALAALYGGVDVDTGRSR